jgi:ParB family transcriptional regulator, chromosome partitioning protein
MKSPTLQMTGPVPLADIEDRNRLRPVSPAGVEALKASIAETGVMKDAIHVRRKKGGVLVLIAGAHRLQAARDLGWETIEAKVWTDVTDDWSRLMEIDDNLAGAEMGPLDTAVFLAERKAVYERLHPEAKATTGAELVARRWNTADTMSVVSFAKVTAEKFGLSDRHVRRLIEIGTALSSDQLRWLRAAKAPIRFTDLQALAKIEEGHDRSQVCIRLSNGAKSAAEALRAHRMEHGGEAPAKDPVEEAFTALSKAWARAGAVSRRRFIRAHLDEVFDICGEEISEVEAAARAGGYK